MIGIAAGILMIGGCIFLTVDYARSRTELDGIVERGDYGSGSRKQTFEVEAEGIDGRMPVEVETREQAYTEEETEAMFRRITGQMEEWILGDNDSLDRVEQDLNLMTAISGEPVDISWELDRYDVMNVDGEIQEEALEEGGTLVTLTAVLTYREEESRQARYQCVARVYPRKLSGTEAVRSGIAEAVETAESGSREESSWKLPGSAGGRALAYYEEMDRRGVVMVAMALLMLLLIYAKKKQDERQEENRSREQMRRDYPEIVSRMALFLGAGMTVRRAFRRIAEEYERKKDQTGIRCAYEEMWKTCREMESGHSETESYENYGRRCQLQEYLRFAALLSQNLRKGTGGLARLLKLEAVQAFEERKARARRMGEEAATKLLLPMFLMLAVVLIIVIVPAFLSLQI